MVAKRISKKAKASGVADLRTVGVEELRGKLGEQRQELFSLRFRHATAQLEKTSELKRVRREVARIMTVLKEKE